MKKIFTLSFIFLTTFLFAQSENNKKVFLDSLSRETTEGEHSFYMIIKDYQKELSEYETTTYYKSGKISRIAKIKNKKNINNIVGHSIGYYESGVKRNESFPENANNPIRKFFSWHENGNLELEKIVDFKKRLQSVKEYYDNGKLKSVVENNFNNQSRILQFWNKNDIQLVKDGNGNYLDEDDKEKTFGTIKNGYKIGKWTKIDKKTKEYQFENYDSNGNRIRKNTVQERNEVDNTIYSSAGIEVQPSPKNGIKDFMTHIQKTFKPTEEAVKNKVNGRIFIEFIIEKDGKINDVKLIKGLGYGLDEEAIKVVSNYENWIPGQQKGKNIRVRYSVPIAISLK